MTEITRTVEQVVADVGVDDDGYVTIHVTEPLTVDEARDVAAAILKAAGDGERYLAEESANRTGDVVHTMGADAGVTTCCGRTPFELPRADRVTFGVDAGERVTCGKTTAA